MTAGKPSHDAREPFLPGQDAFSELSEEEVPVAFRDAYNEYQAERSPIETYTRAEDVRAACVREHIFVLTPDNRLVLIALAVAACVVSLGTVVGFVYQWVLFDLSLFLALYTLLIGVFFGTGWGISRRTRRNVFIVGPQGVFFRRVGRNRYVVPEIVLTEKYLPWRAVRAVYHHGLFLSGRKYFRALSFNTFRCKEIPDPRLFSFVFSHYWKTAITAETDDPPVKSVPPARGAGSNAIPATLARARQEWVNGQNPKLGSGSGEDLKQAISRGKVFSFPLRYGPEKYHVTVGPAGVYYRQFLDEQEHYFGWDQVVSIGSDGMRAKYNVHLVLRANAQVLFDSRDLQGRELNYKQVLTLFRSYWKGTFTRYSPAW